MQTATKQWLEHVLAQIDTYFVETDASNYSDSGTMWDLAVDARGAIAEALADEGASVPDAPWASE